MLLPDRLAAFSADVLAGKLGFKPSPEVLATMHRATQALIASGQAERAKRAGDRAPDFMLQDSNGASVALKNLLKSGPVVLTFYRGVWCPFCNMELEALQAALPAIQKRGASLIAVSPQTAPNSVKSQKKNALTFPILSDVHGEVAAAFGLRFALPADLILVYKAFGNDLPLINNDPSWTLPIPGRYVIRADGVIAYAEVNPDYTRRPDPSELFPVLEELHVTA